MIMQSAAAALLWIAQASASTTTVAPETDNTPLAGGIVAVVGDDVITQADLDQRVKVRQRSAPPEYPRAILDWARLQLQHEELDRMIDQKLVMQLVKAIERKDGTPYIVDQQIDAELEHRVEELKDDGLEIRTVKDLYRTYQKELGMTAGEYRALLREQMSVQKYLWKEVYSKVSPFANPTERRNFYAQHADRFSTPVQITIRQIFIVMKRPDAQEAAQAIEEGLRAGEDFVELAQRYDQAAFDGNPARAGRQRTLSFADLEEWLFPIPQTLGAMRKGEISPRIVSSAGIHYFKVEDIVRGEPKPFSEVQKRIEDLIVSERRAQARKLFLEEQRARTSPQIFLPPLPPRPSAPEPATDDTAGTIRQAQPEPPKRKEDDDPGASDGEGSVDE